MATKTIPKIICMGILDTKGDEIKFLAKQVAAKGAESAAKLAASQSVGKLVAERAKEQGIKEVVFDRGGYKYHGRVKALAEGSREAGLVF